MRILDIITESKTTKAEAPKPRNFVAKNAKMGGAGQHKDKKKAAKQGDVKHKNKEFAEAKAATAAFRAGNKKRAELNAMSDEERKAYDKEQQEKQRKRDDARLERERQKNAAKKGVSEAYGRYDRRDAYQRDYDHSIAGMNRGRGEIDDESNLMYRYDTASGRVKQRMIDNHEERSARAEGFRDSIEKALAVHNIIRSKFDPKKWVQKQGNKWVQVYPFGQPTAKDVSEMDKSQTPPGRDGGDSDAGKKEYYGKSIPAKTAAKKAGKVLDKAFDKAYKSESATAGSTSAADMGVGAVYPNKPGKSLKNKDGTVKNALDVKGMNLMTGGSIKR